MFIPNLLFDILDSKRNLDLNDSNLDAVTREWLNRLCVQEFAFYSDDATAPEMFPKMDLLFDDATPISNSIIDFYPESSHNIEKIFLELSQLLCVALELRFFYAESFDKLESIIEKLEGTTITSVELLVQYNSVYHYEERLNQFLQDSKRVVKLTFHGAPMDSFQSEGTYDKLLIYSKRSINSSSHCGLVDPSFFSANLRQFTEAINYNSCLNRKISIDHEGNIKNCPSMSVSYGKTSDVTLSEALQKEGFKNIWSINKDNVLVCKDCEFRYMCQDCRAYIADKDNNHSKPSKCNYDPYEAKWDSEIVSD